MTFAKANSQTPNWVWARSAQSNNSFSSAGEGIGVSTDALGNAYIIGYFTDTLTFGSYVFNYPKGVFLTKYDSLGNLQWAKCGGGAFTSTAIATCVTTDAFGNSYFTGWYYGSIFFDSDTLTSVGNSDIFVVKYDALGNLIWARSEGAISSEQSLGLKIDAFNNLYLTGNFFSPSIVFGTDTLINTTASCNMFLTKFDSFGNVIWAKCPSILTTGFVQSYGVTTDSNGNIYVSGTFGGISCSLIFGSDTLVSLGSYNIFLAKYNSSGNVIWAKCAGDSGYDKSFNVATAGNNNIFITGEFSSSTIYFGSDTLTNSGGADPFLVKYDSAGNVQWAKSIQGLNNDYGYSIATNNADKVYLSGGCYSPSSLSVTFDTLTLQYPVGSYDPSFVVGYDFSGDLLFAKVLASGADDQNGLAVCPSGSIYMVGDYYQTNPFIIGNDSLILIGEENVFVAKLAYSSLTDGISEININNVCNLYPNPMNDKLNIFATENELTEIILYDLSSRKLLQQTFTNTTTINTEQLAKGMYLYTVRNRNGIIKNGKVIKQ